MTDPVDPIRRIDRVSRVGRGARAAGAASRTEPPGRALVPSGPAYTHEPEPPKPAGDAVFAAQLLGGPPRRGLKGGPETLEQARSTYLKNEYSGLADRRAPKGRGRKTEV